jgi:hypothetical protein
VSREPTDKKSASNQHPAASSQHPAASSQQPVDNSQQPKYRKQQIAESKCTSGDGATISDGVGE